MSNTNDFFNVTDISRYSIIYSTALIGLDLSAALLRDTLRERYQCELPVYADTEAEIGEREILLGNTNRPLSQKCYVGDGARRLMTYELIWEDGALQIACGGPHSARRAIAALADALCDGKSLEAALCKKHELAPEHIPLTEGADVRIMSANLLGECYRTSKHDQPVSSERAEIFAKMLVDYAPDIVGAQEVDVKYHAPLRRYFKVLRNSYGISYDMTLEMHGEKSNDSPIFYRADKYRLDGALFEPAPYQPLDPKSCVDKYPSGVSSTRFTSLKNPMLTLALLSVHWHWQKEDAVPEGEQPNQKTDAEMMAARIMELEKAYPGIRVFSTGDFNSHRFAKKYLYELLSDIDGAISSELAAKNGVLIPSFMHKKQYIDHIIGKRGTFDVLLHTGVKNCAEVLTDHQPIFADIKFI